MSPGAARLGDAAAVVEAGAWLARGRAGDCSHAGLVALHASKLLILTILLVLLLQDLWLA